MVVHNSKMNPKTLEELEMTDFETEEKIDEKHYMIIEHPEDGNFVRINTDNYTNKIREVQRERYSPENKEVRKLERAGEDASYNIYIVTSNGRHPSLPLSEDMLKKAFPKTFEYFNEMHFLN